MTLRARLTLLLASFLALPFVTAQTGVQGIFDPVIHLFGADGLFSLYNEGTALFWDSVFALVLFISLAQVALKNKFEGKAIPAVIGIVLAVAYITGFAVPFGFRLYELAPIAVLILFAIGVAMINWGLAAMGVKHKGLGLLLSITVAFLFLPPTAKEFLEQYAFYDWMLLAYTIGVIALIIWVPMKIFRMFSSGGGSTPSFFNNSGGSGGGGLGRLFGKAGRGLKSGAASAGKLGWKGAKGAGKYGWKGAKGAGKLGWKGAKGAGKYGWKGAKGAGKYGWKGAKGAGKYGWKGAKGGGKYGWKGLSKAGTWSADKAGAAIKRRREQKEKEARGELTTQLLRQLQNIEHQRQDPTVSMTKSDQLNRILYQLKSSLKTISEQIAEYVKWKQKTGNDLPDTYKTGLRDMSKQYEKEFQKAADEAGEVAQAMKTNAELEGAEDAIFNILNGGVNDTEEYMNMLEETEETLTKFLTGIEDRLSRIETDEVRLVRQHENAKHYLPNVLIKAEEKFHQAVNTKKEEAKNLRKTIGQAHDIHNKMAKKVADLRRIREKELTLRERIEDVDEGIKNAVGQLSEQVAQGIVQLNVSTLEEVRKELETQIAVGNARKENLAELQRLEAARKQYIKECEEQAVRFEEVEKQITPVVEGELRFFQVATYLLKATATYYQGVILAVQNYRHGKNWKVQLQRACGDVLASLNKLGESGELKKLGGVIGGASELKGLSDALSTRVNVLMRLNDLPPPSQKMGESKR